MEDVIEQTKQENELGVKPIGKLIGKFAVPCVISLLVNALYNIVDQIFIGQGVGYLGNGATNVVFPITVITMAFALLIGDGAASFFSLKLGQKEEKIAGKGIGNAIVTVGIIGLLFFAVFMLTLPQLINIFGSTEKIRPLALDYGYIIVLGIPFMMISTAINSMIRADGSPKYAMITMLVGAVINTILDPIMIFILGWGVKGAAVATIIGQIVSCLLAIVYIKKFKTVQLDKSDFKLDLSIVKNIMTLGVSSFITQMSITVVISVTNNLLTKYGANSVYGSEIALTALGIVMKVNQIVIAVIVGIATGSQPIVGYNYGARNYRRVIKTYQVAVAIAMGFAAIAFMLFMFFPQTIINLFGSEEPLYNEFAQKSFRIFLMCIVLNAFQIVSSIFFQALGKPVKSAVLSLSRQIVLLVPVAIILPIFLGVEGILWAGPVADTLAFLLAITFISIELKKMYQRAKHDEHYTDRKHIYNLAKKY